MVAPADLSTKFALDVQAVDGLRVASKTTGQAGLEAAARQFEALFLNMLLKSMRDATPQDGLMDSGGPGPRPNGQDRHRAAVHSAGRGRERRRQRIEPC